MGGCNENKKTRVKFKTHPCPEPSQPRLLAIPDPHGTMFLQSRTPFKLGIGLFVASAFLIFVTYKSFVKVSVYGKEDYFSISFVKFCLLALEINFRLVSWKSFSLLVQGNIFQFISLKSCSHPMSIWNLLGICLL